MKRFSKMLALGLAAVLVFGMTAQAAGSTDADNTTVDAETLKENASVENKVVVDGKEVEVEFAAPTALDKEQIESARTETATEATQETATKMIESMAASNEKITVKSLGFEIKAAFDLKKPEGVSEEEISKGITISVMKATEGSNYVVLHKPEGKSWEVLPATVKDGKVYVKLTSFSPIVVVEVFANTEKVITETKTNTVYVNNNTTQPQTTSPAVAPKTGETASVAGIMALVLMAGAVICAKKVRYNR